MRRRRVRGLAGQLPPIANRPRLPVSADEPPTAGAVPPRTCAQHRPSRARATARPRQASAGSPGRSPGSRSSAALVPRRRNSPYASATSSRLACSGQRLSSARPAKLASQSSAVEGVTRGSASTARCAAHSSSSCSIPSAGASSRWRKPASPSSRDHPRGSALSSAMTGPLDAQRAHPRAHPPRAAQLQLDPQVAARRGEHRCLVGLEPGRLGNGQPRPLVTVRPAVQASPAGRLRPASSRCRGTSGGVASGSGTARAPRAGAAGSIGSTLTSSSVVTKRTPSHGPGRQARIDEQPPPPRAVGGAVQPVGHDRAAGDVLGGRSGCPAIAVFGREGDPAVRCDAHRAAVIVQRLEPVRAR